MRTNERGKNTYEKTKRCKPWGCTHTHTHTHTHTGILLNENKLCDREDNSLLENKGLLSELKKYILKKGSNTIFVSILDTG